MIDEKEFAQRLSELRMKKGVSAREMSLSIGQNHGYISHIESGQAQPSLSGIFYICEYLGMTPAEFFDTDSRNPVRLNGIIEDMKTLNDRQLGIIAELVKELKNNNKK